MSFISVPSGPVLFQHTLRRVCGAARIRFPVVGDRGGQHVASSLAKI